MRPQEDDTTIRLPLTFDYSGGRGDNKKSNIIISIVLFVITVIVTIVVIKGTATVGKKCLIIGVAWLVSTLFIRFRLMREQTFSDAYETLKEIDNIPTTESFWSIYEIESEYPYVCHFQDGKKGIFIRMEKDVIVGKDENVMFRHFEAISDAYNIAGSSSINMCQIDYMDNVGNDSRLQSLYDSLNDCSNPDMKDALLSMYSNLQDEMSRNYASFDVFLFTGRGKNEQMWDNVHRIIDKLLTGNYLSFKALDIEGVRSTCMAIMNLKDFSAIEACETIVSTKRVRGIIPIKVEHYDGTVTELNKTQAQLKAEAQERARQEEEAKKAKKNKRHKKKGSSAPSVDIEKSDTEKADDTSQQSVNSEKSTQMAKPAQKANLAKPAQKAKPAQRVVGNTQEIPVGEVSNSSNGVTKRLVKVAKGDQSERSLQLEQIQSAQSAQAQEDSVDAFDGFFDD